MKNLSNPDYLVSSINRDIADLIESYLLEMQYEHITDKNKASNLLMVMGAIQACLQEIYKKGLGDKETAMLYYGIADRIIGNMIDKNIPKGRGDAKS